MTNWLKCLAVLAILGMVFSGTAVSSELMIFPSQGQSAEQTEKDKFDCYQWAKQQSGFDPMAPPVTSSAPPGQQDPGGGAVRGAARGAVLGLATGAIMNNDKGRSAAAGAAAGGLIGGMRRRDQVNQQQQQRQQWEQQEANRYAQQRATYNRAIAACLEGKGYTVK